MVGQIYALTDSTGAVRYIGKTTKALEVRLAEHLKSRLGRKTHKNHWIRSALEIGDRPAIAPLERVPLECLNDAERFWIAQGLGLGWRLTNGTSGGDGLHNPSTDVRSKIASALRGRKLSAEHVARAAAGNRGKRRTPAFRALLSAKMAGNKNGLGHTKTAACRALASAAKGGRPFVASNGRTYFSVRAAGQDLGIDHASIRRTLKGRRRTAGGLTFRYLAHPEAPLSSVWAFLDGK